MYTMDHIDVDLDEREFTPRHYTLDFFLVLFIAVLPLWLAVPLSWSFVVYSLYTGSIWSYSCGYLLLFVAALVEVFFSLYQLHVARDINTSAPSGGHGNTAELQAAFTRVLKAGLAELPEHGFEDDRPASPAEPIVLLQRHDRRALDFRHTLRTWFRHVPWSTIRSHEVKQWLYWSIYNAPLPSDEGIPDGHKMVLNETMSLLQMRAGCSIPEGSNPKSTPMRVTLDSVQIYFRPFFWYTFILILNKYIGYSFRRDWKLNRHSFGEIEYLIRVPEGWDSATGPQPICLLHGLGLGLFQYNVLIRSLLREFPDRPILILVQPHISQDLFHPRFLQPMSRHKTADLLASLLNTLGWIDEVEGKGVAMLSHSNGSYVHAWMLKSHPNVVTRSCFCDPVSFASWEGDVCYNFIYRPCRTGMELVMRYFVGTEIGVANTLQRHFQWANNSLFYEEIPNARDPTKSFFLVGGKDAIVNAQRVKKYLNSHGVSKGLWFDPDGRHGSALMPGGKGHAEVVKWLKLE